MPRWIWFALIALVVILGIIRQLLPDDRVAPVYDWIGDNAGLLIVGGGLLALAAVWFWSRHLPDA